MTHTMTTAHLLRFGVCRLSLTMVILTGSLVVSVMTLFVKAGNAPSLILSVVMSVAGIAIQSLTPIGNDSRLRMRSNLLSFGIEPFSVEAFNPVEETVRPQSSWLANVASVKVSKRLKGDPAFRKFRKISIVSASAFHKRI